MQFLNPLVLIGLVAAGIPLLLHLLNLRKLKKVEFSTLKFVKELQKTKIKKIKLKQILLLILRTLIIIFLVLAFARPTTNATIPGFEIYAGRSAVILLDNSFSMDVSDEFGKRLTQAKNSADEIVGSFKEGDEVAFIKLADIQNREQYSFSRNLNNVKTEISKTEIKNTDADLLTGLKFANLLFDDANHLNKELYIISENQKNVFNYPEKDSSSIELDEIIYSINIGSSDRSKIKNYSIDSVNVISSIFQIDKSLEAEVFITNHSEADISGMVVSMNFNNEKVAQRTIDLPGLSTISTIMSSTPKETGVIAASIEIENDVLDLDNEEHFGFLIPDLPNVALVGTPNSNLFIKTLLQDIKKDQSFANISTFTPAEFTGNDPSDYDLLIITGGLLSKNEFLRFKNYVAEGGSLILFANPDLAENDFINNAKELGIENISSKELKPDAAIQFIDYDKLHPIFEGVFEETAEQTYIESASIRKAYVSNSGLPIISMQSGAFLSEHTLEAGKIFYIAVPPNLAWSKFPLTGLFPTLMYRSTIYLTATEDISKPLLSGNDINIEIGSRYLGSGNFSIIDPNGNESFQKAVELPSGNILNLRDLTIEGVYTIKNSEDKVISLLSVNDTPEESNIYSLEKEEISEKLNYISRNEISPIFISAGDEISKNIVEARVGTELWKIFVILALLCAFLEMIVQRITKNEN